MPQAKPFIKWVGGKRGIMEKLLDRFPTKFNAYCEPFLGGGSVFFELYNRGLLDNTTVCLSDINRGLIDTYVSVRRKLEKLTELLKFYEEKHSEDFYYEIRGLDRLENFEDSLEVEVAARFIYLNKAGFNGLHRVNSSGHFNVPWGKRKTVNLIDSKLRDASEALKKVDYLYDTNYQENITQFIENNENGFVYLDPPYDPISESASFTSYSKYGFTRKDQAQLKKNIDVLTDRGFMVVQSNSDTPFIRELYKDYSIEVIHAPRKINNASVNELIISNCNKVDFF